MQSQNQSKIYPKKNRIWLLLVLFFSFFALMGGGFLWFIFLKPIVQITSAKSWVELPCTISKSQVETHEGDGSSTYAINIKFKYQFDSRWYNGGQYNFSFGSSSGHQSKNEVVFKYPVGMKTICYVNPRNPQEAVINREFYDELWFSLIPFIFLLFGVFGVFFSLRYNFKKENSQIKPANSYKEANFKFNNNRSENADSFFYNPTTIKESSGWRAFAFMFVFTAIWFGIILLAIHIMGESSSPRKILSAIFSDLVLFIFSLIGLFLILVCLYLFLKLFNPKFSIELFDSKIYLGDEVKFKITSKGNLSKINKVSLSLVGLESARYTVGTDTKTDTHVFYENQIPVTGSLDRFIGSTLSVKIPFDKMHSFAANHNSIIWKIILKGEISMYPDINTEFIIKVGAK